MTRSDFDDMLDDAIIEDHAGAQRARTHVIVDLDGEDAARLSRIVISRGTDARQVLSELLRQADRPAA